jgi:hypothetical protein
MERIPGVVQPVTALSRGGGRDMRVYGRSREEVMRVGHTPTSAASTI